MGRPAFLDVNVANNSTASSPRIEGEPKTETSPEPKSGACARCEKPTNAPRLPSGRAYCTPCTMTILYFVRRMQHFGSQSWHASKALPFMCDDADE